MNNIKTTQFIGLTEKQANELATSSNFKCSIIKKDNQNFIITEDIRMDRLNFTIVNGLVTSVTLG